MASSKRSALQRYGVVVLTVAVATALNLLIPQLRDHQSFVLFLGAITISARYGGRGPGLLACGLAAFINDVFIWPPPFTISIEMEALVPHVVFIVVAVMMSNFTAQLTRAEETMREQLREREEAQRKILEYQDRLRSLASQLSLAEERERRQIATCLHDRVGQTLALSNIKLRTLRGKLSDPAMLPQIDEIAQLLKQMISEMRSLTFELSPPILYEFGLGAALEWLANHFQNSHGLQCTFRTGGEPPALPQDVRVVFFQAVRELLTNVVKHSGAAHASVALEHLDGSIGVIVQDDGSGFDTNDHRLSAPTEEFGLFSVRERITHLGGSMEVKSAPGAGTTVTLRLPVKSLESGV